MSEEAVVGVTFNENNESKKLRFKHKIALLCDILGRMSVL